MIKKLKRGKNKECLLNIENKKRMKKKERKLTLHVMKKMRIKVTKKLINHNHNL
jgi:hypothetical protein